MSRIREADPSALAELSNAVSVKDAKYSIRDNPSCGAASVSSVTELGLVPWLGVAEV